MGRLGVNLWAITSRLMTKKGSLQEVRGRSRVVPGPESDPRGSGICQKKGHPARRKWPPDGIFGSFWSEKGPKRVTFYGPNPNPNPNPNPRDNKTSPLPAHPNPNSTSKPKPNPSPNPIPNPTPNHHPRSYADAARDFQRPGPGNPTSRRNGNQTHPRQQQMAVTPNHPPLLPLPAPLPNRPPPPLLPRPAPLLNQPPPPPPLPLPLPPPIPPLFPSPNLIPPTTPPPPTNLIPLLLSLTQALQHLVTGGSVHPTGGSLTAPISKP